MVSCLNWVSGSSNRFYYFYKRVRKKKRNNNDKGSTIKLTSEMSESNDELGETSNWLSDQIKANIKIPAKQNCRII